MSVKASNSRAAPGVKKAVGLVAASAAGPSGGGGVLVRGAGPGRGPVASRFESQSWADLVERSRTL